MQSDFLDAHQRHWDDAELLRENQRWANADHLYGLAAECGLKRLMRIAGMPYDEIKDQPSDKADRVHANGAWRRFESYRKGVLARYPLPTNNPFSDWDIADRYAHRSAFNSVRVKQHKGGAKTVCDLITQAQREGLL